MSLSERDLSLCEESENLRIVRPVLLISASVGIELLVMGEFVREVSHDIETAFVLSCERYDLLVYLHSDVIAFLDDEDVGELLQDLDVIGIGDSEVLVYVLGLLRLSIRLIERTEDEIEFSVIFVQRESLDDQGSCIERLSSRDECLHLVGYQIELLDIAFFFSPDWSHFWFFYTRFDDWFWYGFGYFRCGIFFI